MTRDAQGHRRGSHRLGNRVPLFELDEHIGDIAQRNAPDPAAVGLAAQQHGLHLRDGREIALGPDDISALSLVNIAAGNRSIRGAQSANHVVDRQRVAREPLRIDFDPHLLFGRAPDVDTCDAVDPFDTVLHDILEKGRVARQVSRVAFHPSQREPGNRVILGPERAEGRLVGLLRIAAYAVQAVGNEKERAIEVGIGREFQFDVALIVPGVGLHALEPLDPLQNLFLPVDHLALDFRRRRARPVRRHPDDGLAHVGGHLDRNAIERHPPEQDDHDHSGQHRDGPLNRELDDVHLVGSRPRQPATGFPTAGFANHPHGSARRQLLVAPNDNAFPRSQPSNDGKTLTDSLAQRDVPALDAAI